MRKIKLTIGYDGTGYVGWQIQPNGPSIQSIIQAAIGDMTREEIKIEGASRTDAGVHALRQVAHFKTETKIPCKGLVAGINNILPSDISIVDAIEVDATFHARKDALGKTYLYRIFVSSSRSPLLVSRAWLMHQLPDLKSMKESSQYLLGENDFTSFRAAGCTSLCSVCRIDEINYHQYPASKYYMAGEGTIIDIEFKGKSFLRHMIRNIVGALVDVGHTKITPAHVKEILDAGDRKIAPQTAPACGLYLVEVVY